MSFCCATERSTRLPRSGVSGAHGVQYGAPCATRSARHAAPRATRSAPRATQCVRATHVRCSRRPLTVTKRCAVLRDCLRVFSNTYSDRRGQSLRSSCIYIRKPFRKNRRRDIKSSLRSSTVVCSHKHPIVNNERVTFKTGLTPDAIRL